MARIELVNDLLDKYGVMGIRQIYYQFISRDWEPKEWNADNLYYALGLGRAEGHIDPDKVIEGKTSYLGSELYDGLSDYEKDAKENFKLDFWEGSENYVEVWTEKGTLVAFMKPITDYHHVDLTVLHGYATFDAIFKNFREMADNGKKNTILYFGDHDPEGLDIFEKVKHGILAKKYQYPVRPEVIHIGLTMAQVRKYALLSQKVKKSSSRAKRYIKRFGDQCWELDALEPDIMKVTLLDAISSYVDFDLKANQKEEARLRDLITFDEEGGN
jgi:hypothetical protein